MASSSGCNSRMANVHYAWCALLADSRNTGWTDVQFCVRHFAFYSVECLSHLVYVVGRGKGPVLAIWICGTAR